MSLKILIIDDNPDIAKELKDILQAHGHSVKNATNISAGLQLLNEDEGDLLLMDWHLPECNSQEIIKQIHKKYPKLKKIILSGDADLPRFLLQKNSFLSGVFIKPFNVQDLLQAIVAMQI